MPTPARDPLRLERSRFVALARAVSDALLDARLVQDQPEVYRAALARSVPLQVDQLAAHDAFVLRAERLGATPATLAELRRGRAELALTLQQTLAVTEPRQA